MSSLNASLLSPENIKAVILAFFAIYGGKVNPEIPGVNKMLDNVYVKIAFIFAMVYIGSDPATAMNKAIIVTLVYAVVMFMFRKDLFKM